MIFDSVKQLCMLSVLCGMILTLTPEGGAKRIAELSCAAILVGIVLSSLRAIDFEDYALQNARLKEAEAMISANAEDAGNRLNRLVIEREYKAYIMDKASLLGIDDIEVTLEMRWDLSGIWVPQGAQLSADCSEDAKKHLSVILKDDLGIPFERQRWND